HAADRAVARRGGAGRWPAGGDERDLRLLAGPGDPVPRHLGAVPPHAWRDPVLHLGQHQPARSDRTRMDRPHPVDRLHPAHAGGVGPVRVVRMIDKATIANPTTRYGDAKHATREFKTQRLTGMFNVLFTIFFVW